MTAIYNGQVFKTPLLAQWAAFFDLAGWQWARGIAAVGNWVPDYRVEIPCGHSECAGKHTLLVSVLPVDDPLSLKNHPALFHIYGHGLQGEDAGAIFGSNPKATYWVMSHGAGGGEDDVPNWCDSAHSLWNKARMLVN